ncbi:hypothetical protein BaRGS_00035800 [Batillaria attramentaria]|uniref:Uncharacterized protein n=1 Tax=Batillaria attramentaria TaxID=370345 RepID=A0ABD0JDN4_9CAEN
MEVFSFLMGFLLEKNLMIQLLSVHDQETCSGHKSFFILGKKFHFIMGLFMSLRYSTSTTSTKASAMLLMLVVTLEQKAKSDSSGLSQMLMHTPITCKTGGRVQL